MRKIVLLALGFFLISSGAYANDIPAGAFAFSGGTGLGFTTETWDFDGDEVDRDAFSFDFDMEYYFMDNFFAGVLGFYDMEDIDNFETTMFMIGPQIGFNFSINDTVSVVPFGAIGYVSMDDDFMDEFTGWGWTAGGVLRIFPADWVSVNGTVLYKMLTLEDSIDLDIDGFEARVGFSIFFNNED